jgi:hypothetical protein
MAIGAARKVGAHRLADDGPHAVAAGDVGSLAALLPAVGTAKTCGHAVALITVFKELRPSLDDRAQLLEPRDQQPLMLVLRKNVQERIGREARADLLERDARPRFALDPEPDGRDLVAARDHITGEIELAIELERSRVDRQCAGGRAGICGLVDDSGLRAELGQPQREHQTGGPSADDQHVRAGHIILHRTLFAEGQIMRRGQKPLVLCSSTRFPLRPQSRRSRINE